MPSTAKPSPAKIKGNGMLRAGSRQQSVTSSDPPILGRRGKDNCTRRITPANTTAADSMLQRSPKASEMAPYKIGASDTTGHASKFAYARLRRTIACGEHEIR